MCDLQQEIARQFTVKAALVSTTNTQGWSIVKQIADKVVAKAVQAALDEEDSDKGESKRLKAKALQQGFAELFAHLEAVQQYNPESVDDSGLGQLEFAETEV